VVLGLVLTSGFVAQLRGQTNFTVLAQLSTATGLVPFGSLAIGPDGVLYGTTAASGLSNVGGIYRLNSDGSGVSSLFSFSGTNGAAPQAGLALGSNGTLFGATYNGGISNYGTIFKIGTNGSGYQVLHYFTGGSDGKNPSGDPIIASNGVVYGVTYFSTSAARGTIYRIDQDGNNYSIVHTFTGTPDGQQARGKLFQGSDGMLYGTTVFGGISSQLGTIYKVSLDGSVYSTIHPLQNSTSEGNQPNAGVCQSVNGFLYGTVYYGGRSNLGAVFTMDTDGNNYSLVWSFQGTAGDGQNPNTELVESSDGFLYGGTYAGGSGGGALYKIKNDRTGYGVLQIFSSTGGNLNTPSSLIIGANSALYGTTRYGGGQGGGCVYTLTSSPLPPRIVGFAAGANSNLVQCAGTYGLHYDAQRSTNLSVWSSMSTFVAPQLGSFSYTDSVPVKPAGFYRLRQD